MGARRGPIPVRWEATQRPLPEERRIEFTHTGGVTRGMEVAWRFEPVGEAWEVSIDHALHLGWPLIGERGREPRHRPPVHRRHRGQARCDG